MISSCRRIVGGGVGWSGMQSRRLISFLPVALLVYLVLHYLIYQPHTDYTGVPPPAAPDGALSSYGSHQFNSSSPASNQTSSKFTVQGTDSPPNVDRTFTRDHHSNTLDTVPSTNQNGFTSYLKGNSVRKDSVKVYSDLLDYNHEEISPTAGSSSPLPLRHSLGYDIKSKAVTPDSLPEDVDENDIKQNPVNKIGDAANVLSNQYSMSDGGVTLSKSLSYSVSGGYSPIKSVIPDESPKDTEVSDQISSVQYLQNEGEGHQFVRREPLFLADPLSPARFSTSHVDAMNRLQQSDIVYHRSNIDQAESDIIQPYSVVSPPLKNIIPLNEIDLSALETNSIVEADIPISVHEQVPSNGFIGSYPDNTQTFTGFVQDFRLFHPNARSTSSLLITGDPTKLRSPLSQDGAAVSIANNLVTPQQVLSRDAAKSLSVNGSQPPLRDLHAPPQQPSNNPPSVVNAPPPPGGATKTGADKKAPPPSKQAPAPSKPPVASPRAAPPAKAAPAPKKVVITPTRKFPKKPVTKSSLSIDYLNGDKKVGDLFTPGFSAPHEDACPNNGRELKVIVFITSAPSHSSQRTAVRQTWGHFNLRRDVVMLFMVGQTNKPEVQAVIDQENDRFADIVQSNVFDDYRNLTLKSAAMFEWIKTYCSEAPFVLKTDDDMYINMPLLFAFIDSKKNEKRVMFGRLGKGWKPVRSKRSKYYVDMDTYSKTTYPEFVTGPAYLFTTDIVDEIYQQMLKTEYLFLEDVFVSGIIGEYLKIRRVGDSRFRNDKVKLTDTCKLMQTISIHMVKYEEQFDIYKRTLDGKLKCKPK